MTAFARIRLDPVGPVGAERTAFARVDGEELHLLRGAPWESLDETGDVLPLASARLAAPVAPSKIVCIGRNYRAHAAELGNEVPPEPLLFFKPPSALIGPDEPIVLPRQSVRVDHEAEIGVVLGARCRNVTPEAALAAIFGATCVNDVTARDLQKKDGQWTRAKGFDTFCPAGPLLITGLDFAALGVRCRVSGDLRQDGNTRDMMFPVGQIIAYISEAMTLEPGDLIVTGTPSGVGPLTHGDIVEVEVDGIGALRNPVRALDR